jgi:hypothetical protein
MRKMGRETSIRNSAVAGPVGISTGVPTVLTESVIFTSEGRGTKLKSVRIDSSPSFSVLRSTHPKIFINKNRRSAIRKARLNNVLD